MARFLDVSSQLAEYMLKGWVLTDRPCPKGCNVPLMRSPNGTAPVIHFCANCDGDPSGASSSSTRVLIDRATASSPSITPSTHYSRASTPPTEISSALSSPTFAPPMDTAETLRRRRQSDAASVEIGKRMLKGWTMLADECPSSTCYGIPLVRPPKLAGGKDPRKECVACGTVYIDEKDANGWDRLVPLDASNEVQSIAPLSSGVIPSAGPSNGWNSRQDKGKGRETVPDETPQISDRSLPPLSSHNAQPSLPRLDTSSSQKPPFMSPEAASQLTAGGTSVLRLSEHALETTLVALSERLIRLSKSAEMIDPSSIGQTADAISRVAQALSQVKQLQAWSGSSVSHAS